jgi:capsular exopolysaccharide synthesis family protein
VSHVWDAMKKHKAENPEALRGAEPPSEPAKAQGPAQEAPRPAVQAPVGNEPPLVARIWTPPKAGDSSRPTENYSEAIATHHDRGGPVTEQFRALRTHLLSHFGYKRFSIIITSSEPGEGKTVTCINLGIVLAEQPEKTTVIVDGDLRRGRIASNLGMDKGPGMAELLRGSASMASVVRPTAYPNLFVIPAGEVRQPEVGELMGRPELKEIGAELRQTFDHVLIDTPPLNGAADAGMLGQAVDGALVVVHMNKTHRESVDRAIRLLHASNVTVTGMVLTHQKYFIPNYLYRYS